jgi:hypothetical protein
LQELQAKVQVREQISSMFPPSLQQAFIDGETDVEVFARAFLGMELHDGQRHFIKNSTKKINLLLPSNRWGKTLVVAIKHIQKNFYKTGIGRGNAKGWRGVDYRTADISPMSSQTEMCFRYVKAIVQGRFPIPQPDGSVKNNESQIKWFIDTPHILNSAPYLIPFINNSRVEFHATGADKGDSLQSKPYGYISYDEGGRSNHLELEIWSNILPRLADWRGTLDIPCTPDTDSPSILYHYKLFNRGLTGTDPFVYSQEGGLEENSFLSMAAKQDQYDLYEGTTLEGQVLRGEFVFSGANIFPAEDILEAESEQIEYSNKMPKDGMPRVTGHKYIFGIDTAIGSDERVYTVVDVTNPDMLYVVNKSWCKGNAMSPLLHQMALLDLWDMYYQEHNVTISLETWNGESARFYMDMPDYMQRVTKCFGSWQPPKRNNKKKRLQNQVSLIVALCKQLAAHQLQYASTDSDLTEQLNIYKEDDTKLPTDHVFSLALAVFLATDGKRKTKRVELVTVDW